VSSADVDWAEAERRGRRIDLLAAPLVGLVFAAMVVLRDGEFAFWEGRAAWLAAAVPMVVVLVVQVLSHTVPRLRARQGQAHRIQHTLRAHVDPGPEIRSRLDVQARYLASISWVVRVFPLAPLGLLLTARWDRPATTVPAALVLVAGVVGFTVFYRRLTTAAQRWVAEPPGPPRHVPPPGRRERWMTSPRLFLGVIGAVVVLGLVAGLVIGLAT
jgi:hypothetical protein